MYINQTVTKKVLENLIRETFVQFGSFSSSSLLDSLKFLGFHYATNAGISINIEDLKTPDIKDLILEETTEIMNTVSNDWQQGLLTDIERFQTIIDSWNVATESLKNRIIDYYQNFDPTNNLYIMAFSGARGNMSQVRQLVGMRGLMADQSGKIIDLPIQTNFREGLTPIDYMISAYGARKGIVDTALKTADSGYLTRRLIYVAQDLIIREKNCHTKKGIIILFDKKTPIETLIGRTILSVTKYSRLQKKSLLEKEILLTKEKINEFKKQIPLIFNFRSALTCRSMHSICQKCYGWDLSQQKFISLGEAVGIIAAQSIGEPGTQLTMRTFHTGGIFTGETVQQILSPFSGKFFFPNSFKGIPYRTNHGQIVFKLKNQTSFELMNWKGEKEILFLNAGCYLYLSNSCFLKKGQVIAEFSTQKNDLGERRLKPIYSSIGGEVLYEKIVVSHIQDKKTKKPLSIIRKSGTLWILSGAVFRYQYNGLLNNANIGKKISQTIPILKLKIYSPFEGHFSYDLEKNVILSTFDFGKIIFSSELLKKQIEDDYIAFFLPLLRPFQKIDSFTLLGYWYFFSKKNHIPYQLQSKRKKQKRELCIYSNQNIWKCYLEEPEQFLKLNKKYVSSFSSSLLLLKQKKKIRKQARITSTLLFHRFGVFSIRKGTELFFHKAAAYFMNSGTTVTYQKKDYIKRNSLLANLISYTQRTEDIVQGLPKIENLIEARIPYFNAILCSSPNMILEKYSHFLFFTSYSKPKENIWVFTDKKRNKKKNKKEYKEQHTEEESLDEYENEYEEEYEGVESRSKKVDEGKIKKYIFLGNRIHLKNFILHNNSKFQNLCLVKRYINTGIKIINPSEKELTKKVLSEFPTDLLYTFGNSFFKKSFTANRRDMTLFVKELDIPFDSMGKISNIYRGINKVNLITNRCIVLYEYRNGRLLYLESAKATIPYGIPPGFSCFFKAGEYIDLGEPLTNGSINMHELLGILFRYHCSLDGIQEATERSLSKLQLLLVNSIQAIYHSQGVLISNKHIEIIVRQMTSKVKIIQTGETPFLQNELISLSIINEIYETMRVAAKQIPNYEPKIISATSCSLTKKSFLAAAGFQETRKILAKAAIAGKSDWFRGLKESIMIGRLSSSGSAFLNYKNNLDHLYSLKKKKRTF